MTRRINKLENPFVHIHKRTASDQLACAPEPRLCRAEGADWWQWSEGWRRKLTEGTGRGGRGYFALFRRLFRELRSTSRCSGRLAPCSCSLSPSGIGLTATADISHRIISKRMLCYVIHCNDSQP